MNRRLFWLAAAGLVCVPFTAAAQVPTVAAKACGPYGVTTTDAAREPDTLTALYNKGDWDALQARGRTIIDAAKTQKSPPGCDANLDPAKLLDYKVNYIALTWIGQDPLKDKPQLMRAIVHEPAAGSYIADLPGVGVKAGEPTLIELLVSRGTDASLASVYTSTREDSPAASQLPAFVQAIAGPLAGTVGAIAGAAGARVTKGGGRGGAPPPPSFYVTIYSVGLPLRRASVHLQANARDSVDATSFRDSLTKLATAVKFKEAAYSNCARDYADAVAGRLANTRDTDRACQGNTVDPLACVKAFDNVLRRKYGQTVAKCGTPKSDADALHDVDQKFRDLIRTYTSATADLDIMFHNRPLTHWSYGAGSAVIGKGWLTKPRVKLDDSGNLKADPLTRVMTMAFVNWSPAGYDEQTEHMRTSERWRLFFGAALTPDFGPIGGLNVTVVRGIGLTIGGGLLFAKGADPGDIGKAPQSSTDPFRLSVAKIAFAGISYNFK